MEEGYDEWQVMDEDSIVFCPCCSPECERGAGIQTVACMYLLCILRIKRALLSTLPLNSRLLVLRLMDGH